MLVLCHHFEILPFSILLNYRKLNQKNQEMITYLTLKIRLHN